MTETYRHDKTGNRLNTVPGFLIWQHRTKSMRGIAPDGFRQITEKTAGNTVCIAESFEAIRRKADKQDPHAAARRSLCGVAI
jgi:hypothetical protein